MGPEDVVWNRACDWYLKPFDARSGDLALRDMISFNGLAMNGGPLHAAETVGDDGMTAALAAYRFFGLEDAANVVAWLVNAVKQADPADADAAESIEFQANERYYAAVPDDEVLVAAFEQTYGRSPEAFLATG
jgi:hypothetical protein